LWPASLSAEDAAGVVRHAVARIGHRYDLRNVFDLLRYLMPTPPVPLGSGDPTRAICATLIAQAFASVRYPILPTVERRPSDGLLCPACVDEILHVRHHCLYVPRDFDVSPCLEVIKPTLAGGVDHRQLRWNESPVQSA